MRGSVFARLRKASMGCLKNNSSINNSTKAEGGFVGGSQGDLRKYEAYRDLDKLNFATVAKILLTKSSEKKIFGFDFHLVRLFFTCVMPPLALCLVAQYAPYAISRTVEEVERKKTQAEEEEKGKELEVNVPEEKAAESDPELKEVEMRTQGSGKTGRDHERNCGSI